MIRQNSEVAGIDSFFSPAGCGVNVNGAHLRGPQRVLSLILEVTDDVKQETIFVRALIPSAPAIGIGPVTGQTRIKAN